METDSNHCQICEQRVAMDPTSPPGEIRCPHCGHLIWLAGGAVLEELDFMVQDAISRDLSAESTRDVIEQLVRNLQQAGRIPEAVVPSVIEAVLEREGRFPTTVGRGYAIPHIKHSAINKLMATIGYIPGRVAFDEQGEPVHTVILVLVPPNQAANHLRALERIAKLLEFNDI